MGAGLSCKLASLNDLLEMCAPSLLLTVGSRRLRVGRLLGEGGYAYVYAATDAATGRQYALKKMRCPDSERLANARREIAALRRCRHAAILPLVAAEVVDEATGGGQTAPCKVAYLLFELWEEGTLYERLEQLDGRAEWLPAALSVAVLLQVAEALESMHALSPPMAHYDVKPHNVLVAGLSDAALAARRAAAAAAARADGGSAAAAARGGARGGGARPVRVALMDFGSARECELELTSRKAALELSEFAEANVTASYRAPELFDPPSRGRVDARVDVWSLGCLLFSVMNGGRSPFEDEAGATGGSLALAAMSGKVRWKVPDEPADAPNDWSAQQPPALKALCEELLTVDAAARPTMSVATDRLRAILAAAEAGEPHVAAAPAGVHVELPAMRPPAQEAPPDEEAEILANRE